MPNSEGALPHGPIAHTESTSSDHAGGVSQSSRPHSGSFDAPPSLRTAETAVAFVVFATWLALFAGGILVDTKPYRFEISPSGVDALEGSTSRARAVSNAQSGPSEGTRNSTSVAWIVVLTCFLPINLAWICATASTLGAFGNLANLSDDDGRRRSRDRSNPYLSAVLRGFFVYLFMTSGLLLLDDAPFANPAPGQYIRLAGFLSLFSFVVSYQPRLFNVLIVWAFHRIQLREGEGDETTKSTSTDTLYAKRTTVEVGAQHIGTVEPARKVATADRPNENADQKPNP